MNSINWCSERENLCRLNRERCSHRKRHSWNGVRAPQIKWILRRIFDCKARFTGFDKWAAHERKVIDKICPKIVYSAQNSVFLKENSYEFPSVCDVRFRIFWSKTVKHSEANQPSPTATFCMEFYSFDVFAVTIWQQAKEMQSWIGLGLGLTGCLKSSIAEIYGKRWIMDEAEKIRKRAHDFRIRLYEKSKHDPTMSLE